MSVMFMAKLFCSVVSHILFVSKAMLVLFRNMLYMRIIQYVAAEYICCISFLIFCNLFLFYLGQRVYRFVMTLALVSCIATWISGWVTRRYLGTMADDVFQRMIPSQYCADGNLATLADDLSWAGELFYVYGEATKLHLNSTIMCI